MMQIFFLLTLSLIQCKSAEHHALANIDVNKLKLDGLSYVLNSTLKYEIGRECSGSTVTLKADYINIADVVKIIKYNSTDNICNVLSTNESKSIYLFALNTVFINKNVNLTEIGIKRMTIIAPNWEIKTENVVL